MELASYISQLVIQESYYVLLHKQTSYARVTTQLQYMNE
jgi:hypothetical protein